MKIKFKIIDKQALEQKRDILRRIDEINFQDIELELTEENIKKVEELKKLCNKLWLRTDIKIVSSDSTELTSI